MPQGTDVAICVFQLCPFAQDDDESSVRSSAVRGNFTSGRRPLGSSSSVLKVPNRELKKQRRRRQQQRHKTMISLVKRS